MPEITSRQAAYERNETAAAQPRLNVVDAKWKVLVGAVQDVKMSTPYLYTTEKPDDSWISETFNDKSWQTGLAPFGDGDNARTNWKTSDIYLRKTFDYDGGDLKNGGVVISHDEDTEVYVNGQKILSVTGFLGNYRLKLVTEALRKALKPGRNMLAVHTHQTTGGQYIDLAIIVEQQ